MRTWLFVFSALAIGASAEREYGTAVKRLDLKQTYVYRVADGCRIHADLYRPDDDVIRPVVIRIYGGALIGGDRNGIPKAQLANYVANGFAVVSIDYRLAPETKLPDIISDLKSAYRWMRQSAKTLHVDPDRIAVVGHSAGGYLTQTAGFCLRPRPRCLVSFYGYGDITGEWYSRPDAFYSRQEPVSKEEAYSVVGGPPISENPDGKRFRFYLYCRQNGLWPKEVAGFDPIAQPREFDPYCPVRNIDRAYPPTLLLHGDHDTDVPYALAVQMDAVLTRYSVEHELITIHGGGHGFDGARNPNAETTAALEHVQEFLRAHLK